jgi:hypothetical protein
MDSPPKKRKARPQARSSQVELPKDGALSIAAHRGSSVFKETQMAQWVRRLRRSRAEQ